MTASARTSVAKKQVEETYTDGLPIRDVQLTPLGYQQLTSLTAAATLTVPAGATCATVVCETQNVRWRDDGTAPTATVGMLLPTGAYLTFTENLAALEFIAATAGAVLNIAYYA